MQRCVADSRYHDQPMVSQIYKLFLSTASALSDKVTTEDLRVGDHVEFFNDSPQFFVAWPTSLQVGIRKIIAVAADGIDL